MTTAIQTASTVSTAQSSGSLRLPQMVGPLSPEELRSIAQIVNGLRSHFSVASQVLKKIGELRTCMLAELKDGVKVFKGSRTPPSDSGINLMGDPNKLEQAISKGVSDRKRLVEKVIVPALRPIRTKYRGRSFSVTDKTPKALLYIAVPTEKVGKVVSFDSLKSSVASRFSKCVARPPRGVDDSGRIRLLRDNGNKKELLEFAYHSPGRVSIYVNGHKVGKMWTDDAFKTAKAFTDGKSLNFKKRKTSENYTIC
jgi:hypothetical protein